jgi:glycerophosphoryl diester phosphodiesterase
MLLRRAALHDLRSHCPGRVRPRAALALALGRAATRAPQLAWALALGGFALTMAACGDDGAADSGTTAGSAGTTEGGSTTGTSATAATASTASGTTATSSLTTGDTTDPGSTTDSDGTSGTDSATDTDDTTGTTGYEDPFEPMPAELTVWTFADPADRTAPLFGGASLDFVEDGGVFADAAAFGSASAFGLPPLGGVDVPVLALPALGQGQALRIRHNAAPNGVYAEDGLVSRYTILMDVFVPQEGDGSYRALLQTDLGNDSDAELFLDATPSGGLGVNGNYRGVVAPGQWHRLAFVVRAAPGEGQAHRFIDGTFVGGIGTTGSGLDLRFALGEGLLLFADDNGETGPMYVASVGFAHEALLVGQVEGWGQATAGGVHVIGAAGEDLPLTIRSEVLNFGHRADSCCAPENTLVAMRQAFDKGADHLEVDVNVAADGTVVLFHDATLNRTTDGTGLMGLKTVPELKQLDAGSWFSPRYAGERIPTLAEALIEARGRGRLYLDIKNVGPAMAVGIEAALQETGSPSDAVWIWASEDEIDRYYTGRVTDPRYLLRGAPPNDEAKLMELKAKGVEGFSFGWGGASDPEVQAAIPKANALGLLVEVYTVLDPYLMAELSALGVGGIENDFPAVFQRYRQ